MELNIGDWRVQLGVLVLATFFIIHQKISSIYRYFEVRNIPHIKGKFPVGSSVEQALLKKSISMCLDEYYWGMKNEKMFGIYLGISPFIVIKDPDYVQRVLISDFDHFHDRNFLVDEKTNPLEAHLFFLSGNRWRLLRQALTPIFTSGKLRYMFPEIKKCIDLLMQHLDKVIDGKDIDMKDIFGRFASDVIASTAFGIEPESIQNPENKFRQTGKKLFNPNYWLFFLLSLRFAFPKLLVRLKVRMLPRDITDFFSSIFLDVLERRKKSGAFRKDFVQLLLQLREKGSVIVEPKEVETSKTAEHVGSDGVEKIEITDMLLAAQSFVFLLAGFETTSSCLTFVLYLLSKNKNAQDRAREEVIKIKQKYGEFSYEAVKEMVHLENCISESARYYPPAPMLNRTCVKEYTFPDGTVIEKGTNVIIPVFSIHRDPDYYPNPHQFDPDRFDGPTIRGAWLPFGDGPRNCIGKRFALVEMKTVLAAILEKYYIEKSMLTQEPLEFVPTIQLSPVHPLWVKLTKIRV